jgi:hypothetical protein
LSRGADLGFFVATLELAGQALFKFKVTLFGSFQTFCGQISIGDLFGEVLSGGCAILKVGFWCFGVMFQEVSNCNFAVYSFFEVKLGAFSSWDLELSNARSFSSKEL